MFVGVGKEMKLNISKKYGQKQVFSNLSLQIDQGEVLCVLGASGSGKTTLLNVLAGLTDFEGNIENLPQKFGYVFQDSRLIPSLTVKENLRYVLEKSDENEEKITEILRKTEILHLQNAYPRTLSGGEKQRVAIARAFLIASPILLLDEPFSSLDTPLKIRLGETFSTLWREEKQTVVFVTHDMEEACMLAHRVVVLKDGNAALDIRLDGEIPRPYGQNPEIKRKLLSALL